MSIGALLSYSIIGGISLAPMYIVYKILLASRAQFNFNRSLILGIYGIAFIIMPLYLLLPVQFYEPVSRGFTTTGSGHTAVFDISPVTAHQNLILTIIIWIYLIGLTISIAHVIISQIKLHRLVSKAKIVHYDGYRVAITDSSVKINPFSWGRTIVINETDSGNNLILLHERAHLILRHRYDLIVAQLSVAICWYNPFAWLMRQELRKQHEFQADQFVLNSGTDISDYQMLLIKKTVGHDYRSMTNSLNHSKLKTRITMMNKSSKRAARWLALALVPAALSAAAMLNSENLDGFIADSNHSVLIPHESDYKVSDSANSVQISVINEVMTDIATTPSAEDLVADKTTEKDSQPTGDNVTTEVETPQMQFVATSSATDSQRTNESSEKFTPTIYYVNKKEISPEEATALNSNDIESMEIRKGENANIINITLKSNASQQNEPHSATQISISNVHIDNIGNTNVRFTVDGLSNISVTSDATFVNGDKTYDAKNVNVDTMNSTSVITVSFKKLKKFENDCHVIININGNSVAVYPLKK